MSFPLPSKSAPADAFSDFPLLDAEPVPPRIAAALAPRCAKGARSCCRTTTTARTKPI